MAQRKDSKKGGAAPSRGSTYGTIHQATPTSLKFLTFLIIITGLSVCFWEEFGHTRFEAHLANVHTASPGSSYIRNAAGLWLHTSAHKAAGAKTAVFVVHGFGTHCGRLDKLTKGLHAEGASVYCMDLQGFGRSDGERGYAADFADYVADVEQYIAHVRKADALGDTKVVLVGSSMGGLVATRVVQAGRVKVAGLVTVAPSVAISMSPVDRVLKAVLPVLSGMFPKFPLKELDRSHINQNDKDAAAFMADPLTYTGPVLARPAFTMLAAIDEATAAAPALKVPFLMQVASDDTVTPTAGQLAFFAKIGSPAKKLIEYKGAWHAMLHDPKAAALVPDMAKWIKAL